MNSFMFRFVCKVICIFIMKHLGRKHSGPLKKLGSKVVGHIFKLGRKVVTGTAHKALDLGTTALAAGLMAA